MPDVSVRIEVRAVIACDGAGCGRTVSAVGGVSAATEAARDAEWTTRYDPVTATTQHLCPHHRGPR